MKESNMLLLSDCREPHLALAEALRDGRTVEYWNGRRWVLPDIYETGKDLSVRGLVDWSRYRIQPRQPSDEPGPCPVCGGSASWSDHGGFLAGTAAMECDACGFFASEDHWDRLWVVD